MSGLSAGPDGFERTYVQYATNNQQPTCMQPTSNGHSPFLASPIETQASARFHFNNSTVLNGCDGRPYGPYGRYPIEGHIVAGSSGFRAGGCCFIFHIRITTIFAIFADNQERTLFHSIIRTPVFGTNEDSLVALDPLGTWKQAKGKEETGLLTLTYVVVVSHIS